MGDVTAGQISATGGAAVSIAGAAMSDAPTSTKIETSIGAGLLTAAMYLPPPANAIAAAAGLVAELLGVMGVGSGCGPACVLTAQYANKADEALQKNLDTYFSLPIPRDPAAQAVALQIFDAVWNDLSQQCSNPTLSTAGHNCIADRQAGACRWKQTVNSSYPNTPRVGDCWNWFSGYRDPIAKDPNVGTATGVTNLFSQLTGAGSSTGLNLSALLIPAALLAVIWWAS